MALLIVNNAESLIPFSSGDKMQDIKASILSRGSRKFWYIRYQIFFENRENKNLEVSTKILKTEKNLKYMQEKYLPAALARKKEELKLEKFSEKKFSFYFSKFLKNHADDKSFQNRGYIYQKINRHFGNFEISKITRLMVKEYLLNLKILDASKKKYLACLKAVLDIALDGEIISKNVATSITFRKTIKKPVEPFSTEEVALLLKNSDGIFRNFIGICLSTGMRPGEVLGLMHQNIQPDRICIKRAVSRGVISSPKTIGSVRDIPMFEAARPFFEDQAKLSKSLFLFENAGENITDISFFRNQWNNLIQKCGIKRRPIYNTRHSFITGMLNSGKFKIMDIAAIVGHNSPQMIMTHYAGFLKDSHLKIDTSVDLFENKSDSFSDTLKFEDFKKA